MKRADVTGHAFGNIKTIIKGWAKSKVLYRAQIKFFMDGVLTILQHVFVKRNKSVVGISAKGANFKIIKIAFDYFT